MHADGTGRCNLRAVLSCFDQRHRALLIDIALGVHAAKDTRATNCHIGIGMRNQDGGADRVIAAARGVGAVDRNQNRDAHLGQLGVAVEGGAAAAAVGVNLLLLVELNARAVEDIDQRNAQALCGVGSTQQVIGLAGNPGAGELLVVGSDDDSPLAADSAKTLDDGGGAAVVVHRVVKGVEGAPGALINQGVDTLHGGHLARLVQALGRAAVVERSFGLFDHLLLSCLDLRLVFRIGVDQRPAYHRHILKIAGHRVVAHNFISLPYA
ncbi:hypothetical protein DSECCO2_494360 [anaerobic digester metagenome]